MAQRGLRRQDFQRAERWTIAGGVVVGWLLLYLAAIGKFPVATLDAAKRVVYVFVFAANAAAAGVFVGLCFEVRYTSEWRGRVRWRVTGLVLAMLFVLGVGVLDAYLRLLGSGTRWLLIIPAVVVGGALAFIGLRRFRSNRADRNSLSTHERFCLSLVAGLGGLVAGMLAITVIFAVSTVLYHRDLPGFGQEIPVVRGIEGEYVALGDSYSAGEGLSPFNYGTRGRDADGPESNRCHRSQRAYSQLLEFAGPDPAERFVACSGAVIHDIFHNLKHDEDIENDATEDVEDIAGEDIENVKVHAQVTEGRTYPEVGLVTLTIGGNDMLFSRIVRFCFQEPDCMGQPFGTELDGPRFVDYPEEQPLRDWLRATMKEVESEYDVLFPALRASFPNARIIVIGYPYLFSDTRAGLLPRECTAVLRRVSREERIEVRQLTNQFNDMMRNRALAAGLEYISPVPIWEGHEPCGDRGAFTNAVKLLEAEGSFHPNRDGQLALAYIVASYLRDANTTPPN